MKDRSLWPKFSIKGLVIKYGHGGGSGGILSKGAIFSRPHPHVLEYFQGPPRGVSNILSAPSYLQLFSEPHPPQPPLHLFRSSKSFFVLETKLIMMFMIEYYSTNGVTEVAEVGGN